MGVLDNDYAVMIGAPGTFRDVAEEKILNLQNQVNTANLQYTNDQQQIADLQQKLIQASSAITADEDQITALKGSLADARASLAAAQAQIASLEAQLAALQSPAGIVFANLEATPWSQNSSAAVGGGGVGTASQKLPDANGWAELSIVPAPGAYFDCYYTKTFPKDDTRKKFRLTNDWMFDTQADADACQCLEMEARPIITGGLMFVIACQLEFSGNSLRYWAGPTGKWQSSSSPMPRLTVLKPYTVILDGHRDDLNVFHDSISINGVVTKLGTQYPAFNRNWGAALKCSLQLDSNGKGDPYKVKYRNAVYSAW